MARGKNSNTKENLPAEQQHKNTSANKEVSNLGCLADVSNNIKSNEKSNKPGTLKKQKSFSGFVKGVFNKEKPLSSINQQADAKKTVIGLGSENSTINEQEQTKEGIILSNNDYPENCTNTDIPTNYTTNELNNKDKPDDILKEEKYFETLGRMIQIVFNECFQTDASKVLTPQEEVKKFIHSVCENRRALTIEMENTKQSLESKNLALNNTLKKVKRQQRILNLKTRELLDETSKNSKLKCQLQNTLEKLEEKENSIIEKNICIEKNEECLQDQKVRFQELSNILEKKDNDLKESDKLLTEKNNIIKTMRDLSIEKEFDINEKNKLLMEKDTLLSETQEILKDKEKLLMENQNTLEEKQILFRELVKVSCIYFQQTTHHFKLIHNLFGPVTDSTTKKDFNDTFGNLLKFLNEVPNPETDNFDNLKVAVKVFFKGSFFKTLEELKEKKYFEELIEDLQIVNTEIENLTKQMESDSIEIKALHDLNLKQNQWLRQVLNKTYVPDVDDARIEELLALSTHWLQESVTKSTSNW